MPPAASGGGSHHESPCTPVPDSTLNGRSRAEVPLLAGTDAPVPGQTFGASLHRDLALLVAAGRIPSQALAAATSVPAEKLHLEDRGLIRPGLRADRVLVE